MNRASHIRDHHAFLARLGTRAAKRYERRNSPDLAETIGKIADGFEEHKQTVRELQQRLDRAETRLARPGALGATLTPEELRGSEIDAPRILPPTPAELRAFGQLLRTGDRQYAVEARAAINAGTSGQGLEANIAWVDNIVQTMARDATPLLKIVRTRPVANFPAKHIVGDGRAMGSGWSGEQGFRADTDPPLPKVVEVAAGEWYALPAVTEWAITDLAFDVVGWLLRELADEYSENVMSAIVSGAGNNKPTGFLGGPTPVSTSDAAGRAFGTLQYLATGQAAALPTTTSGVVDLLLDVVHSLRWKHRQNGTWVMSALTISALRKYKDADGRPILLDSMISGQPATLLGYPVIECEAMPSIAAGAFPIAFGDFDAGYVLDRDASGMRITRDDLTTKGFVKFYSRARVGGKVLDSEAIKLVKVATS